MKAFPRLMFLVVGSLPLASQAVEDKVPPSSQLVTNLVSEIPSIVGRFSPILQIESLTLNLNGYAMVGLANTLVTPQAEQSVSPESVLGQTDSRNEARSVSSTNIVHWGAMDLRQLEASPTNLVSLISNILHLAEQSGTRLHIGKMTLNLNGYALVGVTNSAEHVVATQHLVGSIPLPYQSRSQTAATGAQPILNLGESAELQVGPNPSAALPAAKPLRE